MQRFLDSTDRDAIEQALPWAQVDRPPSLHAALRRTAAAHGARPAISFQMFSGPRAPARTLSWDALLTRVTQCANALRRLGVGEGDTVAYVLPNCLETAIVLLAGATAGIVAPVNPLLEPAQIGAILRQTGAVAVVTLRAVPNSDVAQKVAAALAHAPGVRHLIEVDLVDYLTGPKRLLAPLLRPRAGPRHGAQVHAFARLCAAEDGRALAFAESGADRVAARFHTGGTTGMPKVAQHRISGMLYNGWLGSELLFGPTDVLICPLPLFHVFAAYPVLMSCLLSGAHMVMPTPAGYRGEGVFDNFWALVERWGVTFLITVPTALAALMQRPVTADVSSLRTAISGSAPLPPELCARFRAATGVEIAEGYGLTEATCLVSCNPPEGRKKIGSVGLPLPHSHVRILRRTAGGFAPCAVDEVGEICVAGPGVFPGSVYTEADKNRDLFAEGRFLRTGDLGRLDADGYLWITGRAKDLIIRGGHNIDPAAIEEALLAHPAVAFAGAVGQPDAVAGELPCAYVELVGGQEVTVEALLAHARARIPERAAVPRHIEILPELPKTAVGKIFKPDLRRRAIARVLGEALAQAGVGVIEVVEDPKRGLVARLGGTGERAEAERRMAAFALAWEWAEAPGGPE